MLGNLKVKGQTMQSVWSAAQIQGKRDYQEDFIGVIDNNSFFLEFELVPETAKLLGDGESLFVLADGMGFHGNGDVAAKFVVQKFIDNFVSQSSPSVDVASLLVTSMNVANDGLKSMVKKTPSLKGMGCTLVAVHINTATGLMTWLSVGDSSLMHFRNGSLVELNVKHNYAMLEREKRSNHEEFDEQYYAKNAESLFSALTGENIARFELSATQSLEQSDIILIASDGIESLSLSEIEAQLHNLEKSLSSAMSLSDSNDAVDACVETMLNKVDTLELEHQDNATLIIVGFK